MEEYAIKISGLKKKYRLGQIGGGTLRGDIQSWWARIHGKEDPNSKIGVKQRSDGDTFMALNGIDLKVRKGEALGIIGGNGAGKSTLLKILSRVTAPTEGEIDIYGRISSMLEVGTGFNGEMTGRENVYMNGAILGMSKAEVDAKMEEIIEFSEVREFIDTPVKRYSSGMYVKLAFSVAAHLDSEIMIMDEVLAVGDMKFQKKCLDKMRDAANKEGKTILYVSHNMNTIRRLCDRCIVMDKGCIVFSGDVEEAISIYLGRKENTSTFYSCENIPRESISDNKVHIHSLTIKDLVEPIVYDDKCMNLELKYSSDYDYEKMAFRIIFFTSDHMPVGLAASLPIIKVEKGENQLNVSLDLRSLAPGEYSGRIVLYEVNEYGGEAVHDVVDDAFAFLKENRETVNNTTMRWNSHVWGNIIFPEIEVIAPKE